MFDINYRIVDDFDSLRKMSASYFDQEWQHITGFFQVIIGDEWEGSWYHNEALCDGETGPELLEYWFDAFLSVIEILTRSNYVAILEIEIENRWLEFIRDDEMVCIKVAVDSFKGNSSLLVIEPRNTFSYVKEQTCFVQWNSFFSLVIEKTERFLQDVEKLNLELLKTEIVKGLIKKKDHLVAFVGSKRNQEISR